MRRHVRILIFSLFFTAAAAPVTAAGFTISGATVTLSDRLVLSTTGSVTLQHGALVAQGSMIRLRGDWIRTHGQFQSGTSTVTFEGAATSTSTLTGSTTFYTLACVIGGKELQAQAGSTQTVRGSLIVTGSAGNLIGWTSDSPGNEAFLVNSGTNAVNFVWARDSHALGGYAIRAGASSIDVGNTRNWTFGEPAPTNPVIDAVYVSSLTVHWEPVAALTGYSLEASTASDFTGVRHSSLTVSSATLSLSLGVVSPLSANTSYFVRVGALYNGTTSYVSIGSTRTQVGGPPADLVFDRIFVSSLSVQWTPALHSTGYEVLASTDSDFAGTLYSSITTLGQNAHLIVGDTIPLPANTTFYLRVGALYNGATVYAPATLSTVTLTFPIIAHFENVYVASVTVSWPALAAGTGYELQASTSADFATVTASSRTADIAVSTLTVEGLLGNTLYFFRIGGSNWAGHTHFRIVGAATPGVGASPTESALEAVYVSSVTVSWDPTPGAGAFELQASTDSGFTGVLISSVTTETALTRLTVGADTALASNTTYFFRVGAIYGGTATFAIPQPGSTSTLTAPFTGLQATGIFSTSATWTWSPIPTAVESRLEAATSADFSSLIRSSATPGVELSTLSVTGLSAGTTYFFRAGGRNWNGADHFVSAGQIFTPAGPAPLNPVITRVLITSITVSWGSINADDGYRLEASTASTFTGVLFSSTTVNPTANSLTVQGLGANTTYFLRVGSLWNGTPRFAYTTPAFARTVAVLTNGVPTRPPQITGALTGLGGGFIVSWRAVSTNTLGQPTPIGSYIIERSNLLTDAFVPIASVAATTFSYTDFTNGKTVYYRVRASDVNNNISDPSDIIDSSIQETRHILAPDDVMSSVEIPGTINLELLSENNTFGDLEIRLTRQAEEEVGDVLLSYFIGAYRVATGELLPNFAFSQSQMLVQLNYSHALAAARRRAGTIPPNAVVAPYWVNGSVVLPMLQARTASGDPLSFTTRNLGAYQVRLARATPRFALLPGSPFPRILTPNRINENRRLFFFFQNPSGSPVSGTIYDSRGAKIRDLTVDHLSPTSNSLVWDGRNARGGIVSSGIYLYRLESGDETITGSVVVAR